MHALPHACLCNTGIMLLCTSFVPICHYFSHIAKEYDGIMILSRLQLVAVLLRSAQIKARWPDVARCHRCGYTRRSRKGGAQFRVSIQNKWVAKKHPHRLPAVDSFTKVCLWRGPLERKNLCVMYPQFCLWGSQCSGRIQSAV